MSLCWFCRTAAQIPHPIKNIKRGKNTNKPLHAKMTCAPSDDSDLPGHPPTLIRVFAVRSMGSLGPKVSSCGQRRSDQTGRTCQFVGCVVCCPKDDNTSR